MHIFSLECVCTFCTVSTVSFGWKFFFLHFITSGSDFSQQFLRILTSHSDKPSTRTTTCYYETSECSLKQKASWIMNVNERQRIISTFLMCASLPRRAAVRNPHPATQPKCDYFRDTKTPSRERGSSQKIYGKSTWASAFRLILILIPSTSPLALINMLMTTIMRKTKSKELPNFLPSLLTRLTLSFYVCVSTKYQTHSNGIRKKIWQQWERTIHKALRD